jgi:glycosyltransferase involved in cell wall biosynthesis
MREVLDEARRSELIRRGYEQVRRFSWARTARQVLEIYQEVGRSRSGG